MADNETLKEIERKFRQEPNCALANEHRKAEVMHNLATGSPLPVCKTPTEYFSQYSQGVELYFLFLKQMMLVFFLMSLVCLWSLYTNYLGGYSAIHRVFDVSFVLSIGNLDSNEAYTPTWFCNFVYTALLILALPGCLIQATLRLSKVSANVFQLSDYSVLVTGLPRVPMDSHELITHFSQFGEVSEVFLAREYKGLLKDAGDRVKLKRKIYKRIAQVKAKYEDCEEDPTFLKLVNKLEKLDKKLAAKQTQVRRHSELPVVMGFVTFVERKAKVRCLREYKKASWLCFKCPRRNLRLRDTYKLTVKHPSEPTNILYDNLEVTACSRFWRTALSNCAVASLMLVTVALCILIRVYDRDLRVCEDSSHYDVTIEVAQNYSSDEMHCWCKQQDTDEMVEDEEMRELCSDYLDTVATSLAVRLSALAGLLLINYLLRVLVYALIGFERLPSSTKAQTRIMTRVFWAMYISTCWVLVLINADMGTYNVFGWTVLDGHYSEFTREWYEKVGVLYVLILLSATVWPHMFNLFLSWPLSYLKRVMCWRCYKSQYDLEKAVEGPQFKLAGRSARVLVFIVATLTFCGGLPILLPIACVALVGVYWSEKTLLLRYYSAPVQYSPRMYFSSLKLVHLGVLIHCAVSIYMYTASDIFSGVSDSLQSRTASPSTLAMGFLGLVNIAMYFSSWIIAKTSRKCVRRRQVQPTHKSSWRFEDVRESLKQKHSHTYDMRELPEYAERVDGINYMVYHIRTQEQTRASPVSQIIKPAFHF